MKLKIQLFFISTLLLSNIAFSQFSIGFVIGGIGYHPKTDKNSKFYKWKIDKKGKFVGYSSISIITNYRCSQYFGFKVTHTKIFHDCAGKKAGVTHIGINLYDDVIGWNNPSHEFSLSFGPLWYYRKNWTQEPEYQNDPNFIILLKNKLWERKFIWYGGTIEYNYNLLQGYSFSTNILPGYPFLYTAVFGVKKTIQ